MTKLGNYMEFLKSEGVPLAKLLPNASADALELIDAMLQLNPNKRPRTDACLKHKWFDRMPRYEELNYIDSLKKIDYIYNKEALIDNV